MSSTLVARRRTSGWPGTLSPASFRQVGFEVDDDTLGGGRRVVTHEYPNRESWDNEDLGIVAQTVSVRAYVHGDDADVQAAQLFRVCALPGAGELVLPVRGRMRARCTGCYSTFTSNALGQIEFDLEFVLENQARGGLVSTILLAGSLTLAAQRAVDAIIRGFALAFDTLMRRFSPVSLVPSVARDAAAGAIGEAVAALDAARRRLAFRDEDSQVAADYLTRRIAAGALAYAYSGVRANRIEPDAFVADEESVESGFGPVFASAFKALAEGAADPVELAGEMTALASFAPVRLSTLINCRSVRAEKALRDEIGALTRRLAAATLAEAAARETWSSRLAAIEARRRIAETIGPVIAETDDPDIAAALAEMLDAAADYLSNAGAELPATVLVTSERTMPAAVLATLLYEDAARDAEMIDRNGAEHPLFMPLSVEAVRPG